ncbi:membrane or secreted protein [Tellurirhabdus rosea]|uniref:membrane or secreted protein n=1 Tax=Tellurirhabdus rosea TaxID=2674997 RepID=UPI00225B5F1E|nr:membrane or secreted protein [Tellurirhabdus rosea]
MKKAILLCFTLLLAGGLFLAFRPEASSMAGAWRQVGSGGPNVVYVLSDGYLMGTYYENNRFLGSTGGTYQTDGKQLTITIEFDTQDSTNVGQSRTFSIASLTDKQLVISADGESETYERIDQAANAPLAGLWRITGRAGNDGQISAMQRGARKTLKILSGTRFQWAAINPQTKQFSGTGGGTYTLKDGKYTETIEFFSRDNSRVGKSLTFDCEIKGNDWHHRGQSSTGGPVSEVWSREK